MIRSTICAGLLLTLSNATVAQSIIDQENFNGGAADWVDETRGAVTHFASGGRNGGAYISTTANINTSSGGDFGGYVLFRCAVNPSQLPSQNCSSGKFVGNWYLQDGVQELRFWFRHDSSKPGGLQPTIRIAVPGNNLGGSAILPAIPANTWTRIDVPIDPQSNVWDDNWGSLSPNAVQILKNVGRLQPGIYVDPSDPTYTESNVKFDIDDVQIWGSTSIPVTVNQKGTLHPHHNGNPAVAGGLDDPVRVMVYGQSVVGGDPINFDPADIDTATIRIGQLGGPLRAGSATYNLDDDADGVDDARFATDTSELGGACEPAWQQPAEVAFRAELTTGEVVAGLDSSLATNCDAQCH